MAQCVTCGDELHPERAKKYDYCTLPGCQEQNARGLTIIAVGVNKAAEQFVIPTERAKEEMAGGKYQDPRRGSYGGYGRSAPRPGPRLRTSKHPVTGTKRGTESWSKDQQDRALAMHVTGRKPHSEIARRLGLREDTVARMLSAAYAQAGR